jgi:hypothetical protein
VPAHRALERDPEAGERWLKERYPKIRAKARRDGGILLWQDETGFRSQCSHGRSWSPKAQTPIKEATGQRFGVNMISAVGNDGSLRFSLFEGKFNQFVFIDFLKRRIDHHPDRKVHLIVDGHPLASLEARQGVGGRTRWERPTHRSSNLDHVLASLSLSPEP